MPYSSALVRLREAIGAEHQTVQQELQRYLGIYKKMAAYQRDGIVMSAEEHAEWSAAVDAVEKIRALQRQPRTLLNRGNAPASRRATDFSESQF